MLDLYHGGSESGLQSNAKIEYWGEKNNLYLFLSCFCSIWDICLTALGLRFCSTRKQLSNNSLYFTLVKPERIFTPQVHFGHIAQVTTGTRPSAPTALLMWLRLYIVCMHSVRNTETHTAAALPHTESAIIITVIISMLQVHTHLQVTVTKNT